MRETALRLLLILPKLRLGRGTAGRRPVVEGPARVRRGDDAPDHSVDIHEDQRRRHTQRLDTLRGKPRITRHIAVWSIATVVRFVINLNREAHCGTIKVKNVHTGRMLTPESQPIGPVTQDGPQSDLGWRHHAPQRACKSYGPSRFPRYRHRPSTTRLRRVVPLPKLRLGRISTGNAA